MGYRSEVGFAITPEVAKKLDKALAEYTGPEFVAEFVHSGLKLERGEGRLYYWDYVKWYDSYSEIDFLEKFMNSLDEEDFIFIRIGEDDTDIERRGDNYDLFSLGVSRALCWD